VFDERCTYGLIGGNDPDARESGSGTMLLFECIRRGQHRGSEWIDLCGVNSPQRGDFKVSFNAEVQPYIEVHWTRPYAFATLECRDPS
jgi:lipid II:glycine glycyltransferase (peptidoglycan interpeptide bridge formation enzyme)